MEPIIPETIIANTVREGMPPKPLDISIPIGTVVDLGIKDFIMLKSKFKA